jgi:hypothetical protein
MATSLRKRVADILHSEHRVSQTRLAGLSGRDAAELRAIAIGEQSPELRIKALNALAATGSVSSAEVFQRALRDTAAGVEVRAAGATWLSRLGSMGAEGALIGSLAVEEQPIVQHKILAGLARVGSVGSLQRLTDGVASMDPAVREHARFAQSVIAYRNGITGFELPVIEAASRLPARAATLGSSGMAPARPEDGHRVIEQTASDSYGVAGAPDNVALVQCGRRNFAVLLHEPLGRAIDNALARPSIAGLVALRAETDGSFATALLLMCWPSEGYGVHISVNRLSGRTMYFGEGTLDGKAMRFTLDAVRAPGATATTVTGTVEGGRITQMSVALGETIERLRPTPMEDR